MRPEPLCKELGRTLLGPLPQPLDLSVHGPLHVPLTVQLDESQRYMIGHSHET